jgi:hypothetical protein
MLNQGQHHTAQICRPRSTLYAQSMLRATIILVFLVSTGSVAAHAQALNWDGQTGIFITPLAYVVPSSSKGFGEPVIAYHYLDGGSVLGGFHQFSVTEGVFRRVEFGYTRDVHQEGNTAGLSNLWSSGFNVFHGKLNFLLEGRRKKWLPGVSIGFVTRGQVQNVGGVIQNKHTTNADFYMVATKTVTQIPKLPLVFSLGFKGTNASLLGLAGNAPGYEGRLFGAAAISLRGPARSTLLLGSEFLQEPQGVEGLPGAVVPTTITYALRIVPAGTFPSLPHGWAEESPRLTIDLGVAQAAGNVLPGVPLSARHQFALGVSYGF